jgi:hypothetical protein
LEVDVQQGNFKILQLLPHVLIFFLIKNGFFQISQKLQKLVKKTEGILGINAGRYRVYGVSNSVMAASTDLVTPHRSSTGIVQLTPIT